jgi:ribosomal protein S18 acetylase RimI-like enzyme
VAILWTESLTTLDWQALEALYRSAPLGNKNAKDLETAFSNSRYHCFAYEDGIVVAAGRALADGVDASYICDVAVLPSHQGLGLGKDVVQRLMALSAGHKKILLYAVPGKEGFYQRFGFLRMRTAMAVFENPAQAIARGHVFPD